MDSSSYIYAILVQWGARSPALLVYFVGAVLALTYWQSHRVPALLTLLAMVLLGVLTLVSPVVTLSLPQWQREHYWSLQQMGVVSSIINLTLFVGQAVGVGLLLAAVFLRRSAPVPSASSNLPPPITRL